MRYLLAHKVEDVMSHHESCHVTSLRRQLLLITLGEKFELAPRASIAAALKYIYVAEVVYVFIPNLIPLMSTKSINI